MLFILFYIKVKTISEHISAFLKNIFSIFWSFSTYFIKTVITFYLNRDNFGNYNRDMKMSNRPTPSAVTLSLSIKKKKTIISIITILFLTIFKQNS